MPSIYDYNAATEILKLTPPNKRKTNTLAFLGTFADRLQYAHDLFFNDYADGSPALNWINGTTYNNGDRVIYIDYAVYELTTIGSYVSSIAPNIDSANWIKVLDTFVGVRERAHYTGQKIVLEYILNKQFQVGASLPWTGANHANQIYITNTGNSIADFWLSNGSPASLTSFLSKGNQKFFLGNTYTYSQFGFTIYVPAAVAAIINANQVSGSGITYDEVIRQTADKYVQAGYIYDIQTY